MATERILPAIAYPVPARPQVRREAPARPVAATGSAHVGARTATAQRSQAFLTTPARAGMLLGVSAAVYAVSLASVAGIQSSSDAATAAARQPWLDSIAAAQAANDSLEATVGRIDSQTRALTDSYTTTGTSIVAYEQQLDSLAALVAEVQGSVASLPSRISLPRVTVRASSGSAPRTTTTTSASGAP